MRVVLESCLAELEKLAVKMPFIHGTNAAWDVLRPGVGDAILASDPNARAVYVATPSRKRIATLSAFANAAAKARGGSPLLAKGRFDTAEGWAPFNLTLYGKQEIGSVEEARDLVNELDKATGSRRGEIWQLLNRGVGTWRNDDPSATLKPRRYSPVGS